MKAGTTKKDICYQHMAAAYNEVSSGGSSAIARQIAYALRRLTGLGDALRFDYVLKGANNTGLLDQYLRDNPVETADWDVVREDRGTFSTPEGYSVPLGTIPVRNEIARIVSPSFHRVVLPVRGISLTIPKKGPLDDYSGVLYIEKMGFAPLFEATNLLRRRDLAVASSIAGSRCELAERYSTSCAARKCPSSSPMIWTRQVSASLP